MKKIDAEIPEVKVGQKCGMLEVIKVFYYHDLPAIYYVEAKCSCGGKRTVPLPTFLNKSVISCGCKDFFVNTIYKQYENSAKKRNRYFKLTKEEFLTLLEQNCYHCGISPPPKTKVRRGNSFTFNMSGIDRLDNERDYVLSNCVPCCWNCNRAKGELTTEQFETWLIRAYNFKVTNNKKDV